MREAKHLCDLSFPGYCLPFVSGLLSGGILVFLFLWSCVTFDDKTQTLNQACPVFSGTLRNAWQGGATEGV